MLENCFQSERIFSCLSNGGMVKSWEQCRKQCQSKNLEPFYLAKLIILSRSDNFLGRKLKFLPWFANFEIFRTILNFQSDMNNFAIKTIFTILELFSITLTSCIQI